MEITSRQEKQAMVVSVTGRIDATTSPELETKLQELTTGDMNKLVLNLSELEYISSAGLRVILTMAKKLKAAQGEILIAGLQGSVKQVFEISGFYSILKIFDDEDTAIERI